VRVDAIVRNFEISGEGDPEVFRSFDHIVRMNETLIEERSSLPGFTGEKLFSEFSDFVIFLPQAVPQKDKLMENWAIIRTP
jgi:hypothetical protein